MLAGLSFDPPSLKHAAIFDPSEYAISMLAAFTALTKCELTNFCVGPFDEYDDALELKSLQSLSHLKDLILSHGNYACVGSLMHLTSLELASATVIYGDNERGHLHLSKLEQLKLSRSRLEGLPAAGLAACSALRYLDNIYSVVSSEGTQHLDTTSDAAFVVSSLSAMSSLVRLVLFIGSSPESISGLDWVHACLHLEDLKLAFSTESGYL